MVPAACSESPFPERRQVGIIIEEDRNAEALREIRTKRKVVPLRDVGSLQYVAGVRIQWARRGNTDGHDLPALGPNGCNERLHARIHARLFRMRFYALMRNGLGVVRFIDCGTHVRPTDVD